MIDDLGIAWKIKKPSQFNDGLKDAFVYKGLLFDPHFSDGEVTYYSCKLQNLSLIMSEYGMRLFGSVHKYLKGESFSKLDQRELKSVIYNLADIFGPEFWEGEIRNITPSINLPISPKEFLDRIQMIRGKPVNRMLGGNTHIVYGAYLKRTYEKFKIYDKQFETRIHYRQKAPTLTRIEKEYNLFRANKARTKNIIEFKPMDLCEESIKDFCYSELHDTIDSFSFDEGILPYQTNSKKELVSLTIFSSADSYKRFKELVDNRTFQDYLSVYRNLTPGSSSISLKEQLLKALDEEFLLL
jgi:hypothetical protein